MPATWSWPSPSLFAVDRAGMPLGMMPAAGRTACLAGDHGRSILGFSLPNFWLGLMLILAFAVAR